ncbi:hypothetical protein SPFM9_00203 [Salmonella phage SPFM9]|nr:hypothetical protein SPFM9_00203 [Salmonella phage SPFM9]
MFFTWPIKTLAYNSMAIGAKYPQELTDVLIVALLPLFAQALLVLTTVVITGAMAWDTHLHKETLLTLWPNLKGPQKVLIVAKTFESQAKAAVESMDEKLAPANVILTSLRPLILEQVGNMRLKTAAQTALGSDVEIDVTKDVLDVLIQAGTNKLSLEESNAERKTPEEIAMSQSLQEASTIKPK